MNVADEILELLESSGAPLSGEEMARQLGVSRNAVWKAISQLRESGYPPGGSRARSRSEGRPAPAGGWLPD